MIAEGCNDPVPCGKQPNNQAGMAPVSTCAIGIVCSVISVVPVF
jgi:hypothetical protein